MKEFFVWSFPDPNLPRKINYPVSYLAVLCVTVYLTVLIRIKIFKRKIDPEPLAQLPARQQPLPSTLAKIFSTSLADLATVALALLSIVATAGTAVYIGTLDIGYLRVNQHLAYFHFHWLPSFNLMALPCIPFLQNQKLRDFLLREIRTRFYDVQEWPAVKIWTTTGLRPGVNIIKKFAWAGRPARGVGAWKCIKTCARNCTRNAPVITRVRFSCILKCLRWWNSILWVTVQNNMAFSAPY